MGGYNIKMVFQEVGCWGQGLDRGGSEHGRVAGSFQWVVKLLGSIKSGNCSTSSGLVTLSRRALLHGLLGQLVRSLH